MTKRARPPTPLFSLALVLALLGSATAAAGAAQGDRPAPGGSPIAEIRVRGNYLLSRSRVLERLGLSEGDRLDAAALESAVREWNQESDYGTVSYSIEPTEAGAVAIVLEVNERVRIGQVSFRGNEELSDRRLRELIGVEAGETMSAFEVRALEDRIIGTYKDEGYPLASVRAVFGAPGRETRELVFFVAEGPRVYVEGFRFVGNRHLSEDELRDAMRSERRGWPAFIWPGWYEAETFERDVTRVESAYRERGYLDVRAAGDVAFGRDMRSVTLEMVVYEGSRYVVEEVAFEGNTVFRDEELLDRIPLSAGGAFSQSQLEASLRTISGLYADQGYLDVEERKGNLRAEPVFPARGTDVKVRISITEGEPVFIRRVRIRGLTKTKESVVRRNLTIYPGERASRRDLDESERRLLNTGYFDPEVRRPVRITLQPDEGTLRDAVVEVQEGPTGRFLVGAGLGSESGLLGEFSLVEENFDLFNWPSDWDDFWRGNAFRGAGHRLSIILRAGTERSFYSVSFTNPSVYNTEYSFGTRLYSTGIARNEFDETRSGFSLSGGQRLGKFARRTLTLGHETIDIDDIDDEASEEIKRDEGSHSKPFVRVSARVDRRDNRFVPTTGYRANASAELAAGDVESIKLEAGAEQYWTVRERNGRGKHVLGVRGRTGIVVPYSGDRVPVFERFYAGGFSTLRGFEFEGVSPSDPVTEDQVGGEAMLLGSVEYSLPISPEENLRLLGFVDGGYVVEDAEEVFSGWDELRLSTGIGFRWQVPFFGRTALEVDLAAPLMKEDDDETQTLHFSFGAERRF